MEGRPVLAKHDLNELYRRIITSKTRLRQLKIMCAPDIMLRTERHILRGAIDDLLGNDEIAQFVTNVGADAFVESFNHIAGIQIGFPIAVTTAALRAA